MSRFWPVAYPNSWSCHVVGPYVHDASFYELVHKVLTTQHAQELEDAADRERRIRNRQSFSTVQSVAPIIEGRLPKLSELHEVLCHDLSTSGFSFYVASPRRPSRCSCDWPGMASRRFSPRR